MNVNLNVNEHYHLNVMMMKMHVHVKMILHQIQVILHVYLVLIMILVLILDDQIVMLLNVFVIQHHHGQNYNVHPMNMIPFSNDYIFVFYTFHHLYLFKHKKIKQTLNHHHSITQNTKYKDIKYKISNCKIHTSIL